jgi:glycosyltransferase involved in cell wall biosynthesis
MTVILVNDYARINGGSAKVAFSSARGLAGRGHRVVLIAGQGPVDPSLADAPGIEVHCLHRTPFQEDFRNLKVLRHGLWDEEVERATDKILEGVDLREAVLHVHTCRDVLSPSVLMSAIRRNVPVVATAHEYQFGCPSGTFLLTDEGRPCGLRGLSSGCWKTNCTGGGLPSHLWLRTRQAIYRRRIPEHLDYLVFVSQYSLDKLRPYLPPQVPASVVRNPYEAERLPGANPSQSDAFLFVGGLVAHKAPVLAAQAARLANVPIVFVGDGPERERVKEANPDAEITGWLAPSDVQSRIRSSRALVFPSVWFETQGLVVQEALANGIPAVVSDITAATEAVRDGETGFWFRSGSAEDLADKLRQLRDGALADRLGQAAYQEFWSSTQTLDRHLDELEAIYQGVLNMRLAGASR